MIIQKWALFFFAYLGRDGNERRVGRGDAVGLRDGLEMVDLKRVVVGFESDLKRDAMVEYECVCDF